MEILKDKKILLLVTGSIAIYKILDLISVLKKMQAKIAVVMSDEAQKFIQPLCFEAMSNRAVLCLQTQSYAREDSPNHINYASWADIALLAPASVNSIAKLRYGIADNIIITTLLACKCPILIAPSANINMIESKQNTENLQYLSHNGYTIIPPRETLLACNVVANGAMASVEELVFHLQKVLCKRDFWKNKEVVISGGGSIEAIDSVRYISNYSSGLQASNLALAFYFLGAEVKFISSKFPLPLPLDIQCKEAKSSKDFYDLLQQSCTKDSILIMAAAISDFVVKNPINGKIKKENIGKSWNLRLNQNDDILSQIHCAFKVGFKAECDRAIAEQSAKKMLQSIKSGGKGCDIVLLNHINEKTPFGSKNNEITIFTRDSKVVLSKKDKLSISFEIADFIEQYLGND